VKQLTKGELLKRLNKVRIELEAARKELDEDMGVIRVWRRRTETAEDYLRRTYNILHAYDPEKETPMDEVFGLILTSASVTRKQLVEMAMRNKP
jgi:hypothetical protein